MNVEPSRGRCAAVLDHRLYTPPAAGFPNDGDAALKRGDHFILDLDGTLVRGGLATDGAQAFLRAVEGRFMLVSNNSRETGRSLSAKLRRVGFDIPSERIVLAGEATIGFVAHHFPGARCLIATSPILRHHARNLGLVPVPKDADVVILGRDTHWTYLKLSLVANEVRRGAILVAANSDLSHPGHDGFVVPETGSLLVAVEAVAGVTAAHVIGKPAPALFVAALE